MLFTNMENLVILLWDDHISDSGVSLVTSTNHISFDVFDKRKLVLFHGIFWKGQRQAFLYLPDFL